MDWNDYMSHDENSTTPKTYAGKINTHADKPNTSLSAYMTPRRKRAFNILSDQRNVHLGCLVTDAVEDMFGAELNAIEKTL